MKPVLHRRLFRSKVGRPAASSAAAGSRIMRKSHKLSTNESSTPASHCHINTSGSRRSICFAGAIAFRSLVLTSRSPFAANIFTASRRAVRLTSYLRHNSASLGRVNSFWRLSRQRSTSEPGSAQLGSRNRALWTRINVPENIPRVFSFDRLYWRVARPSAYDFTLVYS